MTRSVLSRGPRKTWVRSVVLWIIRARAEAEANTRRIRAGTYRTRCKLPAFEQIGGPRR